MGSCARSTTELGTYAIAFEAPDRLLFCDNETQFARLFGISGAQGYCKDAFHEFVVHGRTRGGESRE